MFTRNRLLLAATALLLSGCGERTVQTHSGLRVIAMAPSTAEILYALSLSNEVVGVSRFCSYPPDVTNKPFIGGLYDPNWEMIVALQPNFVIGLETQKDIEAQLKALGIGFIGVSHEHINEILQAILTIGKACGKEVEAQQLVQALDQQRGQQRGQSYDLMFSKKTLNHRTDPSAGDPSFSDSPRVLVCVGHDESLSRMYVAARGTFYDELIEQAGGINACKISGGYPEISPEGLAAMNPDVIIDIPSSPGRFTSSTWQPYRAVIMTNDYASIPGPRFILLLQDVVKAIHESSYPD